MNRFGFALVSLGTTVAVVGWYYEHHIITGLGLLMLVGLALVAAFRPSDIAFDSSRQRRPVDGVDIVLSVGFILGGFLMALAGYGTWSAGGKGEGVFWGGAVLIATGFWYIRMEDERLDWVKARARRARALAALRRRESLPAKRAQGYGRADGGSPTRDGG